jgi:hypothetical protein
MNPQNVWYNISNPRIGSGLNEQASIVNSPDRIQLAGPRGRPEEESDGWWGGIRLAHWQGEDKDPYRHEHAQIHSRTRSCTHNFARDTYSFTWFKPDYSKETPHSSLASKLNIVTRELLDPLWKDTVRPTSSLLVKG